MENLNKPQSNETQQHQFRGFQILSWILFIIGLLPVIFFSAFLAFFNGDAVTPRHDWGYLVIIILYCALCYLANKFLREQLQKGRKALAYSVLGIFIVLLVSFIIFLLS